jgi:hypothetical protein
MDITTKPMLIFTMPVDGRVITPGFNRGRLCLINEQKELGRWVFSSSVAVKQEVNDWNVTGGVIPPTAVMPSTKHWEFHTARLSQPGQFVNDGFLITFNGATSYKTNTGFTRSEIMVHDDKNRSTNLGSLGCIVALSTEEWESFCATIKEHVAHLITIPLYVIYTF